MITFLDDVLRDLNPHVHGVHVGAISNCLVMILWSETQVMELTSKKYKAAWRFKIIFALNLMSSHFKPQPFLNKAV